MTYKELLIKLAKRENFDWQYSIKHLTVDECFSSDLAEGKQWSDTADIESLAELA